MKREGSIKNDGHIRDHNALSLSASTESRSSMQCNYENEGAKRGQNQSKSVECKTRNRILTSPGKRVREMRRK